jgi:hypothetical protein
MAKISGNFGTGQTANGVVELLSPLAMVWRRPIEWGGTSSLGSNGVSVTFTNTNLPKEGEVIMVGTDGKATTPEALTAADTGAASLCVVWTGYEQNDSGAVDTLTVLDGGYFVFDISSDRVTSGTPPVAGSLVYYDASVKEYTVTAGAGSDFNHNVGVCEGTRTAAGATYYRIRWSR